MKPLEGSGTPVPYIGRTVLEGWLQGEQSDKSECLCQMSLKIHKRFEFIKVKKQRTVTYKT